jgi:hypothetical protein
MVMIRRALVIAVFSILAISCVGQIPALGAVRDGASPARRSGDTGTLAFHPDLEVVRFGRSITVRGSLTANGAPVAGAAVLVHRLGEATGSGAVTDAQGLYETIITPRANASWAASAGELQSDAVLIRVAPRVTLALSHKRTATRLVEYFSGSVGPNHAGRMMVVQRATAAGWRTVASGKLSAGSRYRIAWVLPRRSATYRLRVVLPAHGDHAQGSSQPATLQVVVSHG